MAEIAPHSEEPLIAARNRWLGDRWTAALAAILLLGVGLRLYAVQISSLWFDEIGSIELACGHDNAHQHVPTNELLNPAPALTSLARAAPWWQIGASLRTEPHPPLFTLLLRAVCELLGTGDVAARLLPMLASIACILLIYECVAGLSGKGAALWAALMMALSGQQVAFAAELRSYSLLTAVSLGACSALISIWRRGTSPGRLLTLGTLTFLAVFTHYFAVGALAGMALFAMIVFPPQSRWRVAFALGAAAAAFCALWGPFVLQQHGAFQSNNPAIAFLFDHEPAHVTQTLYRLLRVPAAALWPTEHTAQQTWIVAAVWIIAAAWAFPIVLLRKRQDLLFWYLVTSGAVAVPLALDVMRGSRHLAYDRYILVATPGICGVFASAGAKWKGSLRHVMPAAMTVVCLVGLRPTLSQLQSRLDWQVVATVLSERSSPGDGIVLVASLAEIQPTYLNIQHYMNITQHPVALITQPPGAPLAQALGQQPRTLVVYPRTAAAPALLAPATLQPIGLIQNAIVIAQVAWPASRQTAVH